MDVRYQELGYQDEVIDRFLDRIDNQLIYYSTGYLSAVRDNVAATKAGYLVGEKQGEVIGLLPLIEKTVPGFGTVINSSPYYGSHGGVISEKASGSVVSKRLIEALDEYAREKEVFSTTVVTNPFSDGSDSEVLKNIGYTIVDERISQSRHLATGGRNCRDEILESFHHKARNAVRKGLKTGVQVREQAGDAALNWIYTLHEESIRSMGGVPKKFQHFLRFKGYLGNELRCFLGAVDEVDCCGLIVLTYGGSVEYFTPVSNQEFRNQQVLPALIFEVMIKMSEEGKLFWNWGGTWKTQEGVYRFKDRLGSTSRPYFYLNRLAEGAKDISIEACLRDFSGFYIRKFT